MRTVPMLQRHLWLRDLLGFAMGLGANIEFMVPYLQRYLSNAIPTLTIYITLTPLTLTVTVRITLTLLTLTVVNMAP